MKARQLLSEGSFDPETLKAVCQAFDEAWAGMANSYGSNPLSVESARLRLANAVLAVASKYGSDVAALKAAALQHLAINYPE